MVFGGKMWLFVLFVLLVPVQSQKVIPDPDTIEGYKQTPDGLKFRCGFVGSTCDLKFSNSLFIFANGRDRNGQLDQYIMIIRKGKNWSVRLSRDVTSSRTDKSICFYLRYRIPNRNSNVTLHAIPDKTEPDSAYKIPASQHWSEAWLQLHADQLQAELRGEASTAGSVLDIQHISVSPEKCSRPAEPVSCNGSMWLNTTGWSWANCFHVHQPTTSSKQPTTSSSQTTRGVSPESTTNLPLTSTTEINKRTPTQAGDTTEKTKATDTTTTTTSNRNDITTTDEEVHIHATRSNTVVQRKVVLIGLICGGLLGVIVTVSVIIFLCILYNSRKRRVPTRDGYGAARTNNGLGRAPLRLPPTVVAARTAGGPGVEVNTQSAAKSVEYMYPVSTV